MRMIVGVGLLVVVPVKGQLGQGRQMRRFSMIVVRVVRVSVLDHLVPRGMILIAVV